jgi:hypothetical protein
MRRINWEVMSRLTENDVSGAARIAIKMLEPLPHIDVEYLRKRAEQAWWRFTYSFRSKHAAWWERTTAGIWLSLLDITRELQLPVTMDTLRGLRASLLYDTLAARLWPKVDDRIFRRYVRKRYDRQARRVVSRVTSATPGQHAARVITQVDELVNTGRDLLEQVRGAADRAPTHFIQAASKASYAVFNLLSLFARATIPALLVIAVWAAVSYWREGVAPSLAALAPRVALHPAYVAYVILISTFTFRRLQFRFSDQDSD